MPEYDRKIIRRSLLGAARIVRGWADVDVVPLDEEVGRAKKCHRKRTELKELKRAEKK